MIVVLSGPEKVGKTTLAKELVAESRRLRIHAIHCSFRRPTILDPGAYLDAIKLGNRPDTLVVMDRAWPDEMVYKSLLDRPSPIRSEKWAEWCLGRPARTIGIGLMLVPPARRAPLDSSDHRVEYHAERQRFVNYGGTWDYRLVEEWEPRALVQTLMEQLETIQRQMLVWPEFWPPEYVGTLGPNAPSLLLVGERRNHRSKDPMAWAAMTSRSFQLVAEVAPIHAARTNASQLESTGMVDFVNQVAKVIAFGDVARRALVQAGRSDVISLPHPSYITRWRREEEPAFRRTLKAAIRS